VHNKLQNNETINLGDKSQRWAATKANMFIYADTRIVNAKKLTNTKFTKTQKH